MEISKVPPPCRGELHAGQQQQWAHERRAAQWHNMAKAAAHCNGAACRRLHCPALAHTAMPHKPTPAATLHCLLSLLTRSYTATRPSFLSLPPQATVVQHLHCNHSEKCLTRSYTATRPSFLSLP